MNSRLDNDGGPQVIVIDEDGDPQALWVLVGPVFYGNEIGDKPGIWVEYQPMYMESSLQGSMLIDPETWDELDKAVRERLANFEKSNYSSWSEVQDKVVQDVKQRRQGDVK